jgi:hypothetical protein
MVKHSAIRSHGFKFHYHQQKKSKPKHTNVAATEISFQKNFSCYAKEREKSAERKFRCVRHAYLIMPDRFANGNPKNDSDAATKENNRDLPGGRHGGDSRIKKT